MEIVNLINARYKAEHTDIDPWENSPYKNLLKLTIDSRGKVGEEIVSAAIKASQHDEIIINEDISDVNYKGEQVHYDMKVNDLMIEIKTAYRDRSNNWQHENIYRDMADMTIFVDFDYDGIYFSIIPEDLLPLGKDSEIFGRKHGTLRQNRDDGYKLDFSRTTLNHLQDYNGQYSKKFTENNSFEDIGKFITERIISYVNSIQ